MHMQVEDGLPCMLAVIDHDAIPMPESLLLGDLGRSHQKLAQDDFVVLLGPGQRRKSLLVLGDDEDVDWGGRGDVPEGED